MKDKFDFSDEQLCHAAGIVDEAMQAVLPKPEECDHAFSEEFKTEMEALIRKTQKKQVQYKVFTRMAAACLAAVLTVGVWLSVDVSAREEVVDWWAGITDRSYFGRTVEERPEAVSEYVPGWLPSSTYAKTDCVYENGKCTITYDSSDERFPPFQITYAEEAGAIGVECDSESGTIKNDFKNGRMILYTPNDPSMCKTLVYSTQTHSFSIAFYFEDNYARRILENMILQEDTESLLPVCIPTWVPDGYYRYIAPFWDSKSFTLQYDRETDNAGAVPAETEYYIYSCKRAEGQNEKTGKTVQVNGNPAVLAAAVGGGKLLTWTVGDLECSLIFTFDLETAIQIAESTL